MPAKSVIESRIRNRLEAARLREKQVEGEVERLRHLHEESQRELTQVRRDINGLEELLDPNPNPETTGEPEDE